MHVRYKTLFLMISATGILTACGLGADNKTTDETTNTTSLPLQVQMDVDGDGTPETDICVTGTVTISGDVASGMGGAAGAANDVSYDVVLTEADCDNAMLEVPLLPGTYSISMGAITCMADTDADTNWTVGEVPQNGDGEDYADCEFIGTTDGAGTEITTFEVVAGGVAPVSAAIQMNFVDTSSILYSAGETAVSLDENFDEVALCGADVCTDGEYCLNLDATTPPECYMECEGADDTACEEDLSGTCTPVAYPAGTADATNPETVIIGEEGSLDDALWVCVLPDPV